MNKIASVLTGIGSPKAKLTYHVLFACVMMALVSLLSACSDDPAEPPFPVQPVPDPQNWLFTVSGTAANDVYAAGALGAMFHYDGNAQNEWTPMSVSTSKAITRIWNSGDGTLYATGHGGVILRNTSGSWSGMSSGTSKDLYGIGRFKNQIYACGFEGTLLRLGGSSWGGTPNLSWILDDTGAPTDTLLLNQDIASLITVNSFFFGGAYNDPNYMGEPEAMKGTKGGVFAQADPLTFPPPNNDTGAYQTLPDWILRPLSGEQIVDAEWMLSSTSDPSDLSRNYLGTSEGWLFQLSDARGDTVWTKFYPSITGNPGAGIQDIWLDAPGNVYLVTDDGQIVYQTEDYNFTFGTGSRTVLYDGTVSLTGIWGADPTTFYVVGYMDEMLMRCSHDPNTGYFNFVLIPVDFPAQKSMDQAMSVDQFGRPLD